MPATATLNKRQLEDGSGWVIDASWSDRPAEQLLGVFQTPGAADQWILHEARAWRHPGRPQETRPVPSMQRLASFQGASCVSVGDDSIHPTQKARLTELAIALRQGAIDRQGDVEGWLISRLMRDATTSAEAEEAERRWTAYQGRLSLSAVPAGPVED